LRTATDWNQPCPNPACSHYRLMNRGNISAIASYLTKSGKRRIFKCALCRESFSETRETVFFDLRTEEEKVIMALKMLLVRCELTAISFVLGVTEETALEWLKRAAAQAERITQHLLREVTVTQVQLDEMWNFIRRKSSVEATDEVESPAVAEDGRQWIWLAFAPEYRLILAAVVGPRVFETALLLIQLTAQVVCGVPVFFSDGFSCYADALRVVYGHLKVFEPTGKKGRPRHPVIEPDEELVYAQLIKVKAKGRLKGLKEKVIFGAEKLIAVGLKISTSLIERVNETFRHALAPLVRKSRSFCKDRELMKKRVLFWTCYYNFAREHQSLRVLIPEEQRTKKGLIEQKYKQRTPSMAAGLTDHVWTFRELLTAKFEPIHFQSISG
jgi:IS1 family transposase/transposase-like protein